MTFHLFMSSLSIRNVHNMTQYRSSTTLTKILEQPINMLTNLSDIRYDNQQQRKIGSDLDQFEAIESLANQFQSSFRMLADEQQQNGAAIEKQQRNNSTASHPNSSSSGAMVKSPSGATAHLHGQQAASDLVHNKSHHIRHNNNLNFEAGVPPPPGPHAHQSLAKLDLYNSDRPEEAFGHIDQMAINVAREDQQTFTDLVHHLTRNCLNDVEKVRAIFRWITVKNLNTMHFDSSVKPDTPLGLLRGIKNGSESYHVLFKRLCRWVF